MRSPITSLWRILLLSSPYLASLAAAVILVLSLIPQTEVPGPDMNDKIAHFIAYGGLAGLTGIALQKVSTIRLAGGLIAYGGLMEVLQGVLPTGREASVLDALANAGGVAVGLSAAFLTIAVMKKIDA